MTMTLDDPARARAQEIVGNRFPGGYNDHFQPNYPDQRAYTEAIHELLNTTGATTPESIRAFRQRLANAGPIVIFGSCHGAVQLDASAVDLGTDMGSMDGHRIRLVEPVVTGLDTLAESDLQDPLILYRGLNFFKPRSSEFEDTCQGKVLSHMGDGVNGRTFDMRTPEPSRLVAAAIQARDTMQYLASMPLDEIVSSAHEALHLGFEQAFTMPDPKVKFGDDLLYDVSSDFIWLGYRTNRASGPHARHLSKLVNAAGAKLGPSNTAQDVRELTEALNPNREPGKLVFMLRFGLLHISAMREAIRAIRDYSENARVVVDMHGMTTVNEYGEKVRFVGDLKKEMTIAAEELGHVGLEFGGVSLETVHDETRLECVDEPDQRPTHPGDVDPRLNPRQTLEIYNHMATLVT